MRLTVRGVIAAGVALLFVAAFGYLARSFMHQPPVRAQGRGTSLAVRTTPTVRTATAGGSDGVAAKASVALPALQRGKAKTVDIGLRRRGHDDGREGGEGRDR